MARAKVSDLPHFKYHPSPLSTGSIVESDAVCECCDQARGFMYNGSVYCREEVARIKDDRVCFRCRVCGKLGKYHDFD